MYATRDTLPVLQLFRVTRHLQEAATSRTSKKLKSIILPEKRELHKDTCSLGSVVCGYIIPPSWDTRSVNSLWRAQQVPRLLSNPSRAERLTPCAARCPRSGPFPAWQALLRARPTLSPSPTPHAWSPWCVPTPWLRAPRPQGASAPQGGGPRGQRVARPGEGQARCRPTGRPAPGGRTPDSQGSHGAGGRDTAKQAAEQTPKHRPFEPHRGRSHRKDRVSCKEQARDSQEQIGRQGPGAGEEAGGRQQVGGSTPRSKPPV